MNKKEALEKLKECQKSDATEAAHCDADDILCELLIGFGYQDVVDEYHKVNKWFA